MPCLFRTGSPRSSSPIDCICPQRTHGLQCLPCYADADFSMPAAPVVDVWIIPNNTCRRQLPIAATSADTRVVLLLKDDNMATLQCGGQLLHPSRPARTRQLVRCGRNAAWLLDACTCVAGYEPLRGMCLPCLNGTARSLLQTRWTPCGEWLECSLFGHVVAEAPYRVATTLCILLMRLIGITLIFFGVLMSVVF